MLCPVNSMPYTIKHGDTFYLIARTYGLPLSVLLAANPGVDPNRLYIGQVICVPSPTCPVGTTPHVIARGDTFYTLAIRFNTSVNAIKRANPNVNPNNLQIGQIVCIP